MAKVKSTIADVQRAVKAARLAGIGDRLTVSIMPTGEIKISPFIYYIVLYVLALIARKTFYTETIQNYGNN